MLFRWSCWIGLLRHLAASRVDKEDYSFTTSPQAGQSLKLLVECLFGVLVLGVRLKQRFS